MSKNNIKHLFICDFCRNKCKGCIEDLERLKSGIVDDKNKDLIGRKAEIKCLGRFCPTPCKYQDLECFKDLDLKPLIELIGFLQEKCNELIEEKYGK